MFILFSIISVLVLFIIIKIYFEYSYFHKHYGPNISYFRNVILHRTVEPVLNNDVQDFIKQLLYNSTNKIDNYNIGIEYGDCNFILSTNKNKVSIYHVDVSWLIVDNQPISFEVLKMIKDRLK